VSILAIVPILAVAVAIEGAHLLDSPPFVSRVRIHNPSRLLIDVDATSADHDGWVAVGMARPSTTTTVREVIDQGSTWVFRFSSVGIEGGELVETRAHLEHAHWTIVIPSDVINRLRRAGARPSALAGI
jgi:hypothetical protein